MAQQVVKDGKGNERIVNKPIPQHLSEKPKLMRRMNIILEGDKAFVSKEQIEQEKQDYRLTIDGIDNVAVLEGLLKHEKISFKLDILNGRIKDLKSTKKEPKKEETTKAE